jgi:hypothetical protein
MRLAAGDAPVAVEPVNKVKILPVHTLGRHGHRWDANIKLELEEIELEI